MSTSNLGTPDNFDTRWESQIYGRGRHMNRHPHNEVVSFVYSYLATRSDETPGTALDVGCGAGNNTVFLAQAGFSTLAVDGSASAVQATRERLSENGLAGDVWTGDFTNLENIEDGSVDIAIDRCAICHCRRTGISAALDEVRRVLRPGGMFFSQMFSDTHGETKNALTWEDGAATSFSAGYFAEIAQTFFASENDIDEFFGSRFETITQQLVSTSAWPGRNVASAHWNMTLRKA